MSAMKDCPDPEVVGAFIDGTLRGDALREMTEHLATCEECFAIMNDARLWSAATPVAALAPRRAATRVAALQMALAAAILIAIALGGIVFYLRGSSERAIDTLVDAAPHSYRSIEPRLTNFPWRELRRMRAEPDATTDPEALKLAGAAGDVIEHADAHPHAAGLAELLVLQPDPAIGQLRAATERHPDDARAWSDLAAAYYTRATLLRRNDALAPGLAAADRALHIDPRHAEALFNRALLLERIDGRRAAAAWRAYLAVDASSPWAREARAHLADD